MHYSEQSDHYWGFSFDICMLFCFDYGPEVRAKFKIFANNKNSIPIWQHVLKTFIINNVKIYAKNVRFDIFTSVLPYFKTLILHLFKWNCNKTILYISYLQHTTWESFYLRKQIFLKDNMSFPKKAYAYIEQQQS